MKDLTNNSLFRVAIVIAIIGLILWLVSSINMIKNNIKRMNLTLNKISNETGVTEEIIGELKNLVLEGNKVEAIKKYRNATGVGLIEAKEFIDSLNK